MKDWSERTIDLRKMLRQLEELSNDKEYVAAMNVVVEMRAELHMLKDFYIKSILGDD